MPAKIVERKSRRDPDRSATWQEERRFLLAKDGQDDLCYRQTDARMPCKGRSSASGVGQFLCVGASGAAISLSCARYVPLNWFQKKKKKAILSKPESFCGSLRISTHLTPRPARHAKVVPKLCSHKCWLVYGGIGRISLKCGCYLSTSSQHDCRVVFHTRSDDQTQIGVLWLLAGFWIITPHIAPHNC